VNGERLPVTAGLVLGVGLGMFVDGIVLHQLLQWHHLVSEYESANSVAGLEENTFWDGVFHAAGWVVTAIGAVLLWRSRGSPTRLPARAFAGLMLAGWGAFNVVDQLVFHLALEAHHIRMVDDYQVYDWTFFALGLALIAVGLAVVRPEMRRTPSLERGRRSELSR